ncbi:hypothetical protein BU15DRAFT_62365 [Melanogaster broomeanus]|nr:hypothetical protein BU15DRAFT_62365 [Melanogaster broomeanus]
MIFLYQAYSFYQDPRYSGTWGAPPWANVSYICRHWRDVALNTPSLWSFLFVSPPRWTKELLSRTKMLPLIIRINVRYWSREEMIFLEQVTTDVTRIQDLSLKLPRSLAEAVFSKLSLLHTLRLFVTKSGVESMLVPDTLFSRETPALRTLELYRCHISWCSPTLTSLTSLRLRDIALSSRPTMTELLAMLCHIPDLAHLYLEDALSGPEHILASQHSLLSECLYLPQLLRLAVVAPFSAVVVFLSNVTVPSKTELKICCRHDAKFTPTYTPLYPLLQQRFNTTSDVGPVIHTLNMKTTEPDVGIVLSTSERDCDVPFYSMYGQRHLHEDWDRGIPLKLDIEFEAVSTKCWFRLMGDICDTIPMVHLRTLAHFATIDMSGPLPSWFFEVTFGNLQELRFIKLIRLYMDDWIPALSPTLCQDELRVKSCGDIFAPALAELQVIAVICDYDCRTRGVCEGCDGSAWRLHEALAHRKAKGHALKKLVIAGSSYVSNTQVEELRKVVDQVEWDGYTEASSDTSSNTDGEDAF